MVTILSQKEQIAWCIYSQPSPYKSTSTKPFKLKKESIIKAFFGSNAVMSVVILGLITIFLFKEGIEFFGQYRDEMNTYRSSGMEYANVVSKQHDSQTLLFRYLEGILANETKFFDSLGENSEKKIQAETAKNEFLKFSQSFQNIKE